MHKELKKRGYSSDQLQAGLMVCRPCHSAIHRAVPDNKQLAAHYSTAEALSQVGARGRATMVIVYCTTSKAMLRLRATVCVFSVATPHICMLLVCVLLPARLQDPADMHNLLTWLSDACLALPFPGYHQGSLIITGDVLTSCCYV